MSDSRDDPQPNSAPRAFSRLEWMIAWRYLRARRKEGAISVIAGFSLAGIMLGVGTLIVVMSVMNGFRTELVGRILGAQPHIVVLPTAGVGLPDYDALARDRKSTRLNSSHTDISRMPSSA